MSAPPATSAPKRRPTLKELMSRSTIYNRHEVRRAKTLLRKGDPRPALLRVLVPSGAAAAIAAVEKKSSSSSSSSSKNFTTPQPVTVDDESVFVMHDAHHATETNIHQTQPIHFSASSTALAAAAGAVFSEAVYGARCLRQASPFVNTNASRVWIAAGQHVSVNPEHAALTVQHTWRSVPSQPNRNLLFGAGISHAQLASRAAPVALLFGTKAAMEHVLQGNNNAKQTTAPPAAISILAAAAAGAVLGSLRSVLTVPSAALTVVGREVAGATLYFSIYDGARHMLVRKDDQAVHPVATASAGALAGVVYDGVRVYGQLPLTATATTTAATRSLATVVVRSAPSHALLFLGYEGTRRLLQ